MASQKTLDFIKTEWKNQLNPGSFSGLSSFALAMKSRYPEKNYTTAIIKQALGQIPAYISHLQMKKEIPRRHVEYSTATPRTIYQADLAQFPDYLDFKWVYLMVDVVSHMVYTSA